MKNKTLIFLLLLLFVPVITMAEPLVEVISVYNRPASEIQPLLLPLLEYTDQIVANGDSLIVKTTPERLQAITNLIRKLDKPLNNLLITVMQSRDATAEQLNAELGFEVNVPLRRSSGPNQFESRIYHQSSKINSTNNNRNTQTIRTLEGATALIKAGNSYPMTQYQIYPGGYGYPGVAQSTQLVDATTGFTVTPTLVGQQVIMDVAPWSDKLNRQGQIQAQEAQTSLRVNLGEWVDLGGVDENGQSSNVSTFSINHQTGQNRLHILLKVDVMN